MKNEDDVLKELLDSVLAETKAMIVRDSSPAGLLAARKYAFNEPGRRVKEMEFAASKK